MVSDAVVALGIFKECFKRCIARRHGRGIEIIPVFRKPAHEIPGGKCVGERCGTEREEKRDNNEENSSVRAQKHPVCA